MPPKRAGRPRVNGVRPRNARRNNAEEGETHQQEQPQPEQRQPEQPQQERPQPARRVEELFLRQNPPTFNGMGDPSEAEVWIRNLERIFNFLQCNNQERMACVTFQLTGAADYWWEAQKKIMTPEQLEQLTWENFKAEVYDQYIPRSYRKEKEMEFYSLQQGRMTVTEYD